MPNSAAFAKLLASPQKEDYQELQPGQLVAICMKGQEDVSWDVSIEQNTLLTRCPL